MPYKKRTNHHTGRGSLPRSRYRYLVSSPGRDRSLVSCFGGNETGVEKPNGTFFHTVSGGQTRMPHKKRTNHLTGRGSLPRSHYGDLVSSPERDRSLVRCFGGDETGVQKPNGNFHTGNVLGSFLAKSLRTKPVRCEGTSTGVI